MQKQIRRIGVLPWIDSKNPYQQLSADALTEVGVTCVPCGYHRLLPITSALRKHHPDALILDWVHTFYTARSFTATLAKTALGGLDRFLLRARHTPVIWNVHNLERHDQVYASIERQSFRRLARSVSGIRVFNQYSVALVRQAFDVPEQVPVVAIPQGNYMGWYSSASQPRSQTRAEFGAAPHETVLLIFGGLRSGKGLRGFVKAFASLRRRDCRLVIAGAPLDEQVVAALKATAKSCTNISLVDQFIPAACVHDYFAAADAVVVPYERILNSGAAMLAISFGKPVLSADLPPLRELLSSEGTLFGNVAEAASLEHMMNELVESDLAKMGEASRSKAETYDWQEGAARMIEVIESSADNAGTRHIGFTDFRTTT